MRNVTDIDLSLRYLMIHDCVYKLDIIYPHDHGLFSKTCSVQPFSMNIKPSFISYIEHCARMKDERLIVCTPKPNFSKN